MINCWHVQIFISHCSQDENPPGGEITQYLFIDIKSSTLSFASILIDD